MSSLKRRYPDPDPEDRIWEQHRLTFLRLYQAERRTLREVKEIMESEHGFPVHSLSTYETKLRDELHLRKKLKKTDWVSIHHHRLKRGDKPTRVYLNGTEIPQDKVWKEIRRSGARSVDNVQDIPLPRDVVVRTPSPVGYLVPRALPIRQEVSQGVSPQLLVSSITMPPTPSSPGALIYSSQNTTWSSQSYIGSSMNSTQQRGKLAELLEVASRGVSTALLSIPWLKFNNFMHQMATTIHCPSESSRVLDHRLSFESLPFTFYLEPEFVSPETWEAAFPLHRLLVPGSHTPSSSVPALNMDIFYLLSKFLYLISNNKLEPRHILCRPNIIQLLLDRIPQALLNSLFREDLPTMRAAWQFLARCAGGHGYRDVFISLLKIGLLHRDWVIPEGTSYLSFAASMGALDVIRSLLEAGIRADDRIRPYQNPAIIEAAATCNIKCMELLLAKCDVNREVRECLWEEGEISIFCIFLSALVKGLIITLAKRDQAYPPKSLKKCEGEKLLVRFSLEDGLQSQALDMLLQNGADVDAIWKCDFFMLPFPNIRDGTPEEHLPTILEQSYYLNVELFHRLLPYSTQTTRLFFRPDICLSAKQGCEFLREYWTSQLDRHGSDGTEILELVLAEQLLVADRAIDTDIIRSLVEFGIRPDTDVIPSDGYIFWHMVNNIRTYGYNEQFTLIFTALLQSGAIIDSRALEAAVEEEGVDILKFLTKFGVNVKKYGVLALSTAARHGNYEAVSWLLEAGVDINAVATNLESWSIDGKFGPWSVIALATTTLWMPKLLEEFPLGCRIQDTNPASLEMLDYLIDHGAELKNSPHDLNAAKFLQRLLVIAWEDSSTRAGLLDLMTFFLSKLDRDDLSSPEVCLLEDCATLSLPMNDDNNVEQLKMSLFELFRSHGAPMPNGDILPYLICEESPPGLIQKLLEDCTSIDTYHTSKTIKFPCTLLQAAAYRGDRDLVEQLVGMGADINMPAFENWGRTALQAAAARGHMALVERLVRMGANINAPRAKRMGMTALQAACAFDAESTTERANMIKVIRFLIIEGADVNTPVAMEGSYSFDTALQIAASNGDIEVAILLIQRGADVNEPSHRWDGKRYSTIDYAAVFGKLDMVQFLLSLGALSHNRGRTGYDGAIQVAERGGHFAVADLMRQHYADDCKLLGTNIARTFLEEESSEEELSEEELSEEELSEEELMEEDSSEEESSEEESSEEELSEGDITLISARKFQCSTAIRWCESLIF
ncbi:ankyrin repeat-containing domain protein [Daldinia vernicosa]|uniref:ankyrin repeat-containing domain protein n=1 Tax=Daldinia vernicosa TaxID=114800 RepID=UPI00200810CA|nr:ankyrin repeat-containing domain protein [Daldinia vernicosa]KAI0846871.1 ankyrin repeat-containing domain protein [Daldinia vernicosa]